MLIYFYILSTLSTFIAGHASTDITDNRPVHCTTYFVHIHCRPCFHRHYRRSLLLDVSGIIWISYLYCGHCGHYLIWMVNNIWMDILCDYCWHYIITLYHLLNVLRQPITDFVSNQSTTASEGCSRLLLKQSKTFSAYL